MHIPTHMLSGWCVANCFSLTARQRMACVIAASCADLDGVTLIAGRDLYLRTHHVLGHSFGFAIVSAGLLCLWTAWRLRLFVLYLFCFHLHLIMDYFGSGRGWPIYYLWPFSWHKTINPNAWDLNGWQNFTAIGLLGVWTIVIAIVHRRTPFEYLVPRWDEQIFRKRPT